jgi:transforming growth factor-beta-induced protein
MILKIPKKPLFITILLILIIIPLIFIWLSSNPSFIEYDKVQMRPSQDIADNIDTSPSTQQFDTLIKLVSYNTFLHNSGPFTVFVPTDSAYTKLDPTFTQTLHDTSNEGTLRQLLLYHIVKGRYLAADITDGMELTTLQGEKLRFKKNDTYIIVNDYSYLETVDIKSKNGVIHTMNSFLLPPSTLK